jgi:hypothetical protein
MKDKRRIGLISFLQVASFILLVAFFWGVLNYSLSAEVPTTSKADDLTPELRILLNAFPAEEYVWTRIGTNPKATEQQKLSEDLNVIQDIWHVPFANTRHAFRIDFYQQFKKGNNVLHLYLKADGDENTGRKTEGTHKGVDYMFTLIDGDPNHSSTRLDVYDSAGKSLRNNVTIIVKDKSVYLVAEISILQKNSKSVFEYSATSYTYTKETPTSSLKTTHSNSIPYTKCTSMGVPEKTNKSLLINSGMKLTNGNVPGWQLSGKTDSRSVYRTDTVENALLIDGLFPHQNVSQTVILEPGHYLLRAHIKTNSFATGLYASTYRMHIGVSDNYKWVELPFNVTVGKDTSKKKTFL